MPSPSFDLTLSIRAAHRAPGRAALLRTAVGAALAQGALPAGLRPALLARLTDDAELRALNAQFRAQDKPTDVLSFSDEQWRDGVLTGVPSPELGEIYISMESCAAQAREFGHALDAELTLLVIHGVLHLLGYDHMQARRKRAMWAAQGRAFALLGRENPLRMTR